MCWCLRIAVYDCCFEEEWMCTARMVNNVITKVRAMEVATSDPLGWIQKYRKQIVNNYYQNVLKAPQMP